MKDAIIKKDEIEILKWLDEYEAWDEAYKILSEHNSEPYLKKVDFYFNLKNKEWFVGDNKESHKLIKINSLNTKSEEIIPLCYELEFVKNQSRLRSDEPEFDNLVEALVEGTKNYIKRYFV